MSTYLGGGIYAVGVADGGDPPKCSALGDRLEYVCEQPAVVGGWKVGQSRWGACYCAEHAPEEYRVYCWGRESTHDE